MHPEVLQVLIAERNREIERRARTAALRRGLLPESQDTPASVMLRLCSVHDDAALERLAELESKLVARGRYVVAEVDGTVVAALPLGPGPLLADPFRPTAHLIPLLELRARQLAPQARRRTGTFWGLARDWSRA